MISGGDPRGASGGRRSCAVRLPAGVPQRRDNLRAPMRDRARSAASHSPRAARAGAFRLGLVGRHREASRSRAAAESARRSTPDDGDLAAHSLLVRISSPTPRRRCRTCSGRRSYSPGGTSAGGPRPSRASSSPGDPRCAPGCCRHRPPRLLRASLMSSSVSGSIGVSLPGAGVSLACLATRPRGGRP